MSVTLALFEKYDSNAHKLPRILLVTVFTSYLIIFLLLNIYLFVKNTLSSKVQVCLFNIYFFINFLMISNFININ